MTSAMTIRPFQSTDKPAVIDLWHQCGLVRPHNDPHEDIARKTAFQPDLFLVAEDDGKVIGTIMLGYEGPRGWINLLAVAPTRQRQGIGRQLVQEGERVLGALGCPKVNLPPRGPHDERGGDRVLPVAGLRGGRRDQHG